MKTSPSRNALLGVLGSTAALSALIAVALARGDGNSAPAPAVASAQPNSVSPGMVVSRDPVTGELRAPTPEDMAALQAAAARDAKGASAKVAPLRSERLPNGAVVTTLDDSTMVYSVATVGADGKVQRACVPADRLEATLEAAQKGSPIKKEVRDEK